MIARTVGIGWQVILADLSLILFMVTAAALANAPDAPLEPDPGEVSVARAPAPSPSPSIAPLPLAEPVGVWRAAPGAPSLGQWLGDVARDPRLRLTITVHYAPGGRPAALAEAARLDGAAGPRGADARIVVEPGQPAGAEAEVGYDADGMAAGTSLARNTP